MAETERMSRSQEEDKSLLLLAKGHCWREKVGTTQREKQSESIVGEGENRGGMMTGTVSMRALKGTSMWEQPQSLVGEAYAHGPCSGTSRFDKEGNGEPLSSTTVIQFEICLWECSSSGLSDLPSVVRVCVFTWQGRGIDHPPAIPVNGNRRDNK